MSDSKTPPTDVVAKAYERRAIEAETAIVSLRREHADALEMARARARYAEDKHAAAMAQVQALAKVLNPIIHKALGMKSRADHGALIRLSDLEINAGKDALVAVGAWEYRLWETLDA